MRREGPAARKGVGDDWLLAFKGGMRSEGIPGQEERSSREKSASESECRVRTEYLR